MSSHGDFVHMDIKTLGVQTCRYKSLIVLNEDEVIVPLGTNLGLWHIPSKRLAKRFQAHQSSIMVLLEYGAYFISCAYDGTIKIWPKELPAETPVASLIASQKTIRHAAVCTEPGRLATIAEFGDDRGNLDVWDLSDIENPVLIHNIKAPYRFCEWSSEGKLFVLRQHEVAVEGQEDDKTKKKNEEDDDEEMKKGEPSSKATKIVDTKKYHYNIEILDSGNEFKVIHVEDIDLVDDAMYVKSDGQFAVITFLNRRILTFDMINLKLVHNFHVFGSGGIVCNDVRGGILYFSAQRDNLITVNLYTETLPTEIDPNSSSQSAGIELSTITNSKLSNLNYNITPALGSEKNVIIIAQEDGLHKVKNGQTLSIEYHSMTCCGVDFHPDFNMIAVGDFTGNVTIWPLEFNSGHVDMINRFNVAMPVRSISWQQNGIIAVGCMGGSLFAIHPFEEKQDYFAAQLEDTITCLRWKHNDLLLASTTQGNVHVIQVLDGLFQVIQTQLIHPPSTGPRDDNFGSLQKYAEVWSVTWSPDGQRVVTSSEDQTCKVLALDGSCTMSQVQQLEGHKRAVTSTDWKRMQVLGGEVFASCSDDQTVRVYDPHSWELLFVLETDFVKDWHTLTYMALEENGVHLVASAQNGVLFVWNLETRKCVFGNKIHNGGIEGLSVKNSKVVVCSSDMCVSVISLPENNKAQL